MESKSRHAGSLALHVLVLFSLPVALAVVTANYFDLLSKYPQLQLEPAATTPLIVENLNITDMEGHERDVFGKGEMVQVEMFLRASTEVARKLELQLECTVYGPQGETVQTQTQWTDIASGQISRMSFGFRLPTADAPGEYKLEIEFLNADGGEELHPKEERLFTLQIRE